MTQVPGLESEFPSPTIVDSRRLMGPNLLHASPGAVLDVQLDDRTPEQNDVLLRTWHQRMAVVTTALGWPDAETRQRVYPGGASLFVQAPIDQLMTATEVNESAWVFAEAAHAGAVAPNSDQSIAVLAALSRGEARSNAEGRRVLAELWHEAQRLALNVTFDDTAVAVGSGAGCQRWPIDAIPTIDEIDWSSLHDIPIVLVTGSNGKTTVVRMVAAMARAAGHTVGYTCTDGVWIGDEQVESGDYSGPAGARRVLQDTRVTLAVLETARGGILRRGLAMQRAAVAAIVTLSPDHFGDFGITDLATLAQAKLAVSHAVRETGALVYNGSSDVLTRALESYTGHAVAVHTEQDGTVHSLGGPTMEFLRQVPATMHGAAKHNVLNAAIAIAIGNELRFGQPALDALLQFGKNTRDNLGRLMLRTLGDVTVVVDYAHNPHGVSALIDATRALPAARRAITLGTGGDRDDDALRAMAVAAHQSGIIDFYIAKEMPRFLRGRAPGTISATLLGALRGLGVHDANVAAAVDDVSAVRRALEWAQPHDLLLLTVHDQRPAILALLDTLEQSQWRAGRAVP
jgi:cyanophycin synthetase